MLSVRLKNPDIILTPITIEEKEQFEKEFMGDESIYVLYKLPDCEEINIGMMSSSMRKYFPATANVWNLENAISKAFFYNVALELKNNEVLINDRPVYKVGATDDRVVSGYEVINATPENNLSINLEDVVDGTYTVMKENVSVLRKLV